jgi:1-acyl-sn-glycerol-3-phosphate acyltransferase
MGPAKAESELEVPDDRGKGAAEGESAPESEPRRYGGDHHRLSVIDLLGGRIDQALDDELLQRDPAIVARAMPLVDAFLSWFDPEIRGFENVPADGAFLVVGNHSGGIYMPDYWAFLRRWVSERGADAPLYSMGFDFLFSIPGWGTLARRLGSVPASQANAGGILASGLPVIVYPGGDEDDYRPWTERHRVDLHGRTGFVKLALRQQVPVIPVVAHGSHDVIIVLARGEALAHRLGFDKLRINIFPLMLGPPWGIAPVQLPTWPLPAKVTVRVCEPIDWTSYPPEAADDPDVVRHCYEDALGRMQANLDEMVEELPHPVVTRVGSFLRGVVSSAAGTARSAITLGR